MNRWFPPRRVEVWVWLIVALVGVPVVAVLPPRLAGNPPHAGCEDGPRPTPEQVDTVAAYGHVMAVVALLLIGLAAWRLERSVPSVDLLPRPMAGVVAAVLAVVAVVVSGVVLFIFSALSGPTVPVICLYPFVAVVLVLGVRDRAFRLLGYFGLILVTVLAWIGNNTWDAASC